MDMGHLIRQADMDDFYFVVETDVVSEGNEYPYTPMSFEEEAKYLDEIARFLDNSLNYGDTEITTCPKFALICEDIAKKERIGLLMFLFRDMNAPTFQHFGIYDKFEREIFPEDGKVCEIFQLWVAPEVRRRGIATDLILKAEEIALENNIHMTTGINWGRDFLIKISIPLLFHLPDQGGKLIQRLII